MARFIFAILTGALCMTVAEAFAPLGRNDIRRPSRRRMDRKPSADKSINLQATNSVIDGDVSKALTERQQALRRGIGRRFVVRSPLPVHSSIMGGPFETDNVVGTLQGGQIVTSVDRIGKFWIKHDAGGWSYVKQNGVISVEFIKE